MNVFEWLKLLQMISPPSLVFIGEILVTGRCSRERGWSTSLELFFIYVDPGEKQSWKGFLQTNITHPSPFFKIKSPNKSVVVLIGIYFFYLLGMGRGFPVPRAGRLRQLMMPCKCSASESLIHAVQVILTTWKLWGPVKCSMMLFLMGLILSLLSWGPMMGGMDICWAYREFWGLKVANLWPRQKCWIMMMNTPGIVTIDVLRAGMFFTGVNLKIVHVVTNILGNGANGSLSSFQPSLGLATVMIFRCGQWNRSCHHLWLSSSILHCQEELEHPYQQQPCT